MAKNEAETCSDEEKRFDSQLAPKGLHSPLPRFLLPFPPFWVTFQHGKLTRYLHYALLSHTHAYNGCSYIKTLRERALLSEAERQEAIILRNAWEQVRATVVITITYSTSITRF